MDQHTRTTANPPAPPASAAETLHLKKLLQTKEMAWLRVLKDAQAKQQCRQL